MTEPQESSTATKLSVPSGPATLAVAEELEALALLWAADGSYRVMLLDEHCVVSIPIMGPRAPRSCNITKSTHRICDT